MAAASDWFLSPGRAEARDARSCSVDGRMLCSTAVQNLPGLLWQHEGWQSLSMARLAGWAGWRSQGRCVGRWGRWVRHNFEAIRLAIHNASLQKERCSRHFCSICLFLGFIWWHSCPHGLCHPEVHFVVDHGEATRHRGGSCAEFGAVCWGRAARLRVSGDWTLGTA